MKCVYVAAFAARGFSLRAEMPDLTLVDDPDSGTKAVLTALPDERLLVVDRRVAAAEAWMRAAFGMPDARPLEERLNERVRLVRESRKDTTRSSPTLIVTVESDVAVTLTSRPADTPEFTIQFDAIDQAAVRAFGRRLVSQALTVILIGTDGLEPSFDRVTEGEYLVADDGHVHYPLTPKGGGRMYTSRVPAEVPAFSALHFNAVAAPELKSVHTLLPAAVDSQVEPLRAFVAAWASLEMLTHALFKIYEDKWFREATHTGARAAEAYLVLVRDAMRRKDIAIRFALVSAMLDATGATEDLKAFRKLKEARDKLFHRSGLEGDYPTAATVGLVRKYLRRHLEAQRR